jgi:hypothetical protein
MNEFEQVAPDMQPPVPLAEDERKPVVFAVRIDPTLREQIEGLRGITEQSVNEVGVEALTDWVGKTLADDTIREKAMAEIDAEERRLQERRSAIAGMLGAKASGETTSQEAITGKPASQGRRRTKQD